MLTGEEMRERARFRQHYDDLTAGDGVPRSLTADEAIEYLTYAGADAGLKCFSHWGSTTADCAPVAYVVALIHEDANGTLIDPDLLDSCMSSVVNDDGPGLNEFFLEHGDPAVLDEYGIEVDPFTESLSSGHIGTDSQSEDAMGWLAENFPRHYDAIMEKFPEYERRIFGEHSSWFDTEAMGVDDEWGSWLVDAIEATGVVYWQDGEPWGNPRGEDA